MTHHDESMPDGLQDFCEAHRRRAYIVKPEMGHKADIAAEKSKFGKYAA